MPNNRSTETKKCTNCGNFFRIHQTIAGVRHHFYRRKYCLTCSPLHGSNCTTFERRNVINKVCARCNLRKTSSDFYRRSRGDLKPFCKKCHDQDGVLRQHAYKVQAIKYKGGRCISCGYRRCAAALEFHHRDPEQKDFTFSKVRRSFNSSKAELDKCDLLCANCHREAHVDLLEQPDIGHPDPQGHPCFQCKERKASSNFPLRNNGKLSSWCRSCTALRQRQRRQEIKQEAVDYKGGFCQMCGYDRCLDALEFHHLDPSQKDLGVAQLRKRLSKIKTELDKCILVCTNCHRETHHAARDVVLV